MIFVNQFRFQNVFSQFNLLVTRFDLETGRGSIVQLNGHHLVAQLDIAPYQLLPIPSLCTANLSFSLIYGRVKLGHIATIPSRTSGLSALLLILHSLNISIILQALSVYRASE